MFQSLWVNTTDWTKPMTSPSFAPPLGTTEFCTAPTSRNAELEGLIVSSRLIMSQILFSKIPLIMDVSTGTCITTTAMQANTIRIMGLLTLTTLDMLGLLSFRCVNVRAKIWKDYAILFYSHNFFYSDECVLEICSKFFAEYNFSLAGGDIFYPHISFWRRETLSFRVRKRSEWLPGATARVNPVTSITNLPVLGNQVLTCSILI